MKFSWKKIRDKLISKIEKDKVKKALMCTTFLLILGNLFIKTTYLFRNIDIERRNIIGLKEEGPLDMVYIGGSAAFVYWQALKAWKDYGFTSYSYAVNTIQAESIKYLIKESLKTHQPEVFVIDLRTFTYWTPDVPEQMEAGFRNAADSIDWSLNRFNMIKYYLANRELDKKEAVVPFYFDIAKYHSNIQALGIPRHWKYINNTNPNQDKGWQWKVAHDYMVQPADFMTSEKAELKKGASKVLQDLLDYCKKEELQVLFVVSPYIISKEDQMQFNTMRALIEEDGFQYLNANEFYEEMQLDFSKDFFNVNHVNCFGAEKYTQFLEQFLKETYNLPDHRKDSAYSQWNENFERFSQEEVNTKQEINELIAAKE